MYEQRAIEFAERFGIREYEVKGNQMFYKEEFATETYQCKIDLDTMKETRKEI